ncbi:MAG: alpha/beta hydrolase [Oscillospiraceae bacterium]|nr:alpha/beta hydrolase [Oscillospiraceae bacterium]
MMIHINNIDIWYKVSGQGDPIVLLHGNGQDHHFFRKLKRKLSEDYTVYAPDSRDHGKSGKVRYLDYMSNMHDIAEFIRILEIEKPILYGFSDGGIVGLLLAIHYPHLLKKLIVSGANTNPDGIRRIPFEFIKLAYLLTSSIKLQMMLTQPNITIGELNTIITPTLVLAGHHDVIRNEHTIEIAENIPGSELKLLRGEGHASYISKTNKIYGIITDFIMKE